MRPSLKWFGILVSVASLGGCASGYTTFYTPIDGATPEAIAQVRASPPPETPKLERASPASSEEIVAAYAKRGYAAIGYSSFNSGAPESEASAIKQGQAVGADLVLVLNPEYTGSITSNVPLTTPTTTTAYTSGTATFYGGGTPVTAYGNATTTVYGSQTTYIPITTHRSDYAAVFFVKQKFRLGAFVRDLDDSERVALQSNQGVVVQVVVDDTPAFFADVLPGDFLLAIDGVRIPGERAFSTMTQQMAGREVELSIMRGGEPLTKLVRLNQ